MLNHGINNWLPEILRATGMTPAQAGFWAACPTAIGIAGALFIPRYAQSERRFAVYLLLLIAAAAATALLALGTSITLLPALLLQGCVRGALMPVTMLLLMATAGIDHRYMGAAGGLFFTAGEVRRCAKAQS